MITCPNCAYQNSDGSTQCSACGSPLPAAVACPQCGAITQADARFCGHCGAQINAVVEQPSVEQLPNQLSGAHLRHTSTNTTVALPPHSTIRIGKPNEQVPPDIDISGFPDSGVVSRVHATIHREGEAYYIEDAGSSNGTYINNLPLSTGSRHRLRTGDRIAFGKADKVAFLFEMAS